MTTTHAITLKNLTLGYRRHPAVHHLSGRFEAGSLTAIVGPNGAGKTTLLKGIVGALKPLSGQISFSGVDRHAIAYLPQQQELERSFPIQVVDLVAMGLWRKLGPFRAVTGDNLARVHEAIAAVGLSGFGARAIGTLSGGQLQRALFARLLLQDAPVVLLDEPFAAIDARTTADLLDIVHRWHGENRIIIAVLHDIDLVRAHFPESLMLARGPIGWGKSADVLRPENFLKARAMCEAWHEDGDICADEPAPKAARA